MRLKVALLIHVSSEFAPRAAMFAALVPARDDDKIALRVVRPARTLVERANPWAGVVALTFAARHLEVFDHVVQWRARRRLPSGRVGLARRAFVGAWAARAKGVPLRAAEDGVVDDADAEVADKVLVDGLGDEGGEWPAHERERGRGRVD